MGVQWSNGVCMCELQCRQLKSDPLGDVPRRPGGRISVACTVVRLVGTLMPDSVGSVANGLGGLKV